jgi:hypothetical protein
MKCESVSDCVGGFSLKIHDERTKRKETRLEIEKERVDEDRI